MRETFWALPAGEPHGEGPNDAYLATLKT